MFVPTLLKNNKDMLKSLIHLRYQNMGRREYFLLRLVLSKTVLKIDELLRSSVTLRLHANSHGERLFSRELRHEKLLRHWISCVVVGGVKGYWLTLF